MSSIKMCDFCGTITGNMAAEILIKVYPGPMVQAVLDMDESNSRIYNAQVEGYRKDACHACLQTLLVTPKPQLTGGKDEESPFGTVGE